MPHRFSLFVREQSVRRNVCPSGARRCPAAACVPRAVRRVLHRTVDFLADSGDARRQAGRRALRAARRRPALPDIRPAGASRVLFGAAAVRRDVRCVARRRARVADAPRGRDAAVARRRRRHGPLTHCPRCRPPACAWNRRHAPKH
ncbi:hypothetical protein BDI4_290069 [Burkholderia diffusa]|nr:hypothetical protein BDI4_290069 [Burkholderia diffusa]